MVENASSNSSFLSHSSTCGFTLSVEVFQLGSCSVTEKDYTSSQVRGEPQEGGDHSVSASRASVLPLFFLSRGSKGSYFSLAVFFLSIW